jgi:hypothetical protein
MRRIAGANRKTVGPPYDRRMNDMTDKPDDLVADPTRPEPGSAENLGLTKKDTPDKHWDDGKKIEDEGEPFDNIFA